MDLQITQSDILVKKSSGEQMFWLSERLLMEICDITERYLRKVRVGYKKTVQQKYKSKEFLPDTGKSWRFAKTCHGFFYCFNNIPDRKPTFYKSKIGVKNDLKKLLKKISIGSTKKIEEELKKKFQTLVDKSLDNQTIRYYMFESPVVFNNKEAQELTEAMAWLKFIKHHYENDTCKKLGVTKKKDFLALCTEILQEKELHGLKINNPDYLRQKINNFPITGEIAQRNFLISNRYNNDNARIVGKSQLFDEDTGEVFDFDAHKALMFYGYMNPDFSGKQAARQIYVNFYKPAIAQFGYEPVAYRTFTHHMSAFHNRIKSARERHGKDYYKKQVQTYVPSKKLQYAHSLFAGDGSGTINYKYVKKDGKLSTMKLYVMLISDVASRKIVGWSVSPKGQHTETTTMMKDAVKMAVKNCDYQTMFEFVSDNHSAFTSKESKDFLNLVFNKTRTIQAGNSQANPAEVEFKLFKQSLKGLYNFTSTSWNVGIEGQSNPDNMNIEDLPTYEDAILQFYDLVKKWNSTELRDRTKPNERFGYKHPNLAPLNDKIVRLIEGNHTEVEVSRMRGFVIVSKTKGYHERTDYSFEIPEYSTTGAEKISKALGYKKYGKVKVVWNEEMADLYTLEDKYILSCSRTVMSVQSHAEADETTNEALGHHLKRKKKQTEALDDFEKSLKEAFDVLPYTHEMQFGSNKEEYNGKMISNENDNIKSKKDRINRDFDESEDWSDTNLNE